VVVDTGVLISAFVFGGIPESAIKKTFSEAEIWVSPQLLEEYRATPFELEADGKITHLQLKSLLSGIASFVVNAKVATPKKRLSLCRDEEDNMILECCFAADADFLITGDKDLLEMEKTRLKRELPKLKIVSPRVFLGHDK
jgi:putative PIN family toxin of toxin-antitoxin system